MFWPTMLTKQRLIWLVPPVVVGAMVVPFAQWGFTDDDNFISFYLVGQAMSPPVWPNVGRFFPLGHQEWRFLPWVRDPRMFHFVAIIQYAVFCWAIWSAQQVASIRSTAKFLFLALLPPVVICFANIVIPERNQLMAVALWLLLYLTWNRSGGLLTGLAALVCVNVALYYKEPGFLFFAGVAVVQIVMTWPHAGGLRDHVKQRWLDWGQLASSVLFVVVYLFFVPVSALTGESTYGGHALDIQKIAATSLQWAIKEPLLFPLLVTGLSLAGVRFVATREYTPFSIALWCGSLLYFLTLTVTGIVGKYYAALPMLGLSLHLCLETSAFPSNLRVNSRWYWLPVIVSIALWVPAIAYKYDWTERNEELVGEIARSINGQLQEVAVYDSDKWDAEMLALYAKEVRKLNVRFFCQTQAAVIDCLTHSPVPQGSNGEPHLRLTLGQVDGRRDGKLFIGPEQVWAYEGIWSRLVPPVVQRVFRPHYNFW